MLYFLVFDAIRILAVVIVFFKMKKMSKSIKKYLYGDVPMNISAHEGHGSQSHHRPIAHTQMQQENNSIYYDLK